MDRTKHIKSIKIENFKCFESFEADNFGQYNIVLGDNNVGKTSFLESLLFENNISQTIDNFQGCLSLKKVIKSDNAFLINPFVYYANKYTINPIINILITYKDYSSINQKLQTVNISQLSNDERNQLKDNFNTNKIDDEFLKVIDVNKNSTLFRKFDTSENFESTDIFMPYVFSTAYYANDLVDFYLKNFGENKVLKNDLIDNLKFLIPSISNIELSLNYLDKEPIIGIWLSEKDSLLPLPMFGDGIVRIFRIILEVSICKNGYLCIDEIDIGIHYSKYKDFCRIILATASANNVQLFISTHNNEFLKSFKEVLEEEKFQSYQNKTKCFALKKLPKGDIKAYRYNFEEFEFAIEQENELR